MPIDEIYTEKYSEKSFVVRGNTQPHKTSLQALEGKWNDRLTDKSTGEKFGGWIYPMTKKETVQKWIDGGMKPLSSSSGSQSDPELRSQVNALRKRVTELESTLQMIIGHLDLEFEDGASGEGEESSDEKPRQSFL